MGTINLFRALFVISLFLITNAQSVLEREECLNYTVYPVLYELNLYPVIRENHCYYDGELTISIIANAPNVNVIELNAKDLEIEADSIKVLDHERNILNGFRPLEYDKLTGKLRLFLLEPLKIYEVNNRNIYYVKMSFRKIVKEDSQGIFLVKYFDQQDGEFKYLFTTRLSPNKAKYFFPCFEDPRFEAVFKFKVYLLKQAKDHYKNQYTNTTLVISQEQRRDEVKDDYIIVDYTPSPQVSLDQMGFHYSQFAHLQASSKNNLDQLFIWAPKHELHDFKYPLYFGISIIDLIHEYSKVNRPITQGPINIVAVPAVINGYEIGSWNLLTNGAHRLVKVEQFTSIKQIETMMFELSQQLSRIWLSNPGETERTRWKEAWFKEGMATYFAHYFLAQHNYGSSRSQRQSLGRYGLLMKHRAMAADWYRSTPPLDVFNSTLDLEIPPRYRELVQMKTGAILWMLESWVESEKFHQAVVNYINSHRGKYISVQDFVTTLDRDTIECMYQFFNGSTASRILSSWFSRGGYPVISVTVLRDRTPNAVVLKQKRFSFMREPHSDTDFMIPISYIMQNNVNCFNCYRPRFTIGAQTYTFGENLDGGWIILNRNASGYYRVNYDIETWKLIAQTLKENHMDIDEMNRAQIVNDVLALYVAGQLDFIHARDVLAYLDQERSPTVWEAVMAGYEYLSIEGAACNMTRDLYWDWERFLTSKISKMYYLLVQSNENDLLSRLHRSNIVNLACTLNFEPCHRRVASMHVEDKRGKNNHFPDVRMSYYYVLVNETSYSSYNMKLNAIEYEDLVMAEKKIHDRNRFLIKIPKSGPLTIRPINIMMSSTQKTPQLITPEPLHGAAYSRTSTLTIVLVFTFMHIFTR